MRADLALIGFGHVGQRFATLLAERRQQLLDDHDLDARIVGIVTRRHGAIFDAAGVDVTAALNDIASERSIDDTQGAATSSLPRVIAGLGESKSALRVAVETTTLTVADGQPAISHIEAAIDAGCHTIAANKGPVAFAYDRLRQRADAAGVSFLFEGAVMDGVPIFNLGRETLPAVTVTGFRGIVNSTTNHILTALEDGEAFAPALARMQAEGIAEADPSLDVDGWDAAAKAAALANVLMMAKITPHDVEREGIDERSAAVAQAARRAGRRLRLIASARRGDDGVVRAVVRPTELEPDDPLGGLRGTANALVLQTDLLGEIAVHQLWGNLTMTAYALLSDLIAIRRRAISARGTVRAR